jgi:large subunit ribosomal protein L54
MICRKCLRAASKVRLPSSLIPQPQRFLTTSARLYNATPISPNVATQTAPRQGDSTSSHTPPAATSTSAAQPFSEPFTPAASGSLKGQATEAAKKKVTPLVKSSIPAGMPLKGLNFEKNKQDPVALADDEYPAWLWTILQRQEKTAEGAGQGDLFCTSYSTFPFLILPQNQNRPMQSDSQLI